MKTYIKYILRDSKRIIIRLISIIFITTIGIGFLVGILTTAPNMFLTIENYYKEYKIADIIIQKREFYQGTTSLLPSAFFEDSEISEIENYSNVDQVMPYHQIDYETSILGKNQTMRILLLDFENGYQLNNLKVVEGRLPAYNEEYVEVVVEQAQTYLSDFEVGFKYSQNDMKFLVVGKVKNPWYFALTHEISPITKRNIDMMIYTDSSFRNEMYSGGYTSLALSLDNSFNYNIFEKSYEDYIKASINSLESIFTNYLFTSRFDNQSFIKFQSDINIVKAIALIFPVFFFMITILVSISSMSKIISDQRMQIGTLRFLGFSKKMIYLKYIIYALVGGGIGSIFGIILGVFPIPYIVYNTYLALYSLPPLVIEYHAGIISLVTLLMIFSIVLVTVIVLLILLREKPIDLLKAKAPKPGRKILLEYTGILWKKLQFKHKSMFRNIFRNKVNFIMTLIGVSGSTALLFAGFGIKSSIDLAGSYQFNNMINYQAEILTSNSNNDYSFLDEYEYTKAFTQSIKYESSYLDVVVLDSVDDFNNFFNFKDINGGDLSISNDSVFVSKSIGLKYNLAKGDNIDLEILGVSSEYKITNVIDYYFGNIIYLPKEMLDESLPYYTDRIYVKYDQAMESDFISIVDSAENIIKVIYAKDNMQVYQKTSDSMNSVIIILVAFATALALIINHTLTMINISARYKEIATLKVLGYNKREISGYIFREIAVMTSIAILLGVLIGRLLHLFIISQITIDGILFSNNVGILDYLFTILIAFTSLAIIYFVTLPNTNKVNMIDSLKTFE